MTQKKPRQIRPVFIMLSALALLLLVFTTALARNSFLKEWEDAYPHSNSGDAGCALCHGTSTANLNTYGKDLCDAFNGTIPDNVTDALRSIDSQDSDGNGDSNLAEIDAGAQPGWTAGAVNQIYVADLNADCAPIGSPVEPPAGVPLPYDPPAGGDPVAIPGGPYTGNVAVPVHFDGSASYDSDGGDIVSFQWDFGDGMTGDGETAEHTYAAAGDFTVSLTVIDDEGVSSSNSTTASISADTVLDLDIDGLKISRTARVDKAIAIELAVDNDGPILGQAFATVVGIQNNGEVYRWRLNVYDDVNKKATSFEFPAFVPQEAGEIQWTVTINDADPDIDIATATTTVK